MSICIFGEERKMTSKQYALELDAQLINLRRISIFIRRTLKELGIHDADDIFKVELAIDEAATNIINHSYLGSHGKIQIKCELKSNQELLIKIMDWGKSPHTLNISDELNQIDTSLLNHDSNGLGLFLIKESMDSVNYFISEEYNELSMIKEVVNRD